MKDEAIIKRFEEELAARGITPNGIISWKEASLAARWTAGDAPVSPLGIHISATRL
jgi:hypothetical protein